MLLGRSMTLRIFAIPGLSRHRAAKRAVAGSFSEFTYGVPGEQYHCPVAVTIGQ